MNRVDALLAEYGSYHRTRGNLVCHSFGITLIVYGILALLQEVPLTLGGATAAELLIAAAFVFYLFLDVPLAFAILVAVGLLDVLARAAGDWRVGLAAFLLGWILQGIGHAVFEKNKPAFLRNLVHLMVGLLFLVNELLRIRHARPAPVTRE